MAADAKLRGCFICLEGIDHSGKTTHARRLCEALCGNGIDARIMAFPDRTTATGKLIDECLRSTQPLDAHALLLLFSANRWEKAGEIRRLLAAGTTVVADRYCYSGAAYGIARGIPAAWCAAPDAGLPRPDIVLQLELPVASALARASATSAGAELFETADVLGRVAAAFSGEIRRHEERWLAVDSDRPADVVLDDLLRVAMFSASAVVMGSAVGNIAPWQWDSTDV